MPVDLDETPTSELVDELKRRSDTCVIMLVMVNEGGKREFQYYTDGEMIVQLGLVEAQKKQILDEMIHDDLDGED